MEIERFLAAVSVFLILIAGKCRYLELDTAEFMMGTVIDAVISQGMITSREKGLQLVRETPREIKSMCLFGDQTRLQQVLADFLLNAIRFTPSTEGWVGIKVVPSRRRLGGGLHVVHLEFRYICLNQAKLVRV
jgi:phytochrome B